jgi:enoyl-CoA hydratase/carnithine racemase
VILTGGGEQAFSAGMDVNPDNPQVAGLISAVQARDPGPVREMLEGIHANISPLFALPVPIIAAVNGMAYGGGAEIATRCDLRVVDETASFCFSEVKLGLMPDLGGGVALTRLIGAGRAADLILTARRIDAEEALRLGLANRVVPAGTSLAAAIELGEAIAANGPRAVRTALSVIRRATDQPVTDAIADEVERAIDLIASGECSHGIAAFMTRSSPTFPDPE